MTNNEIIINQAIAHGIYTKAEAQAIVAAKAACHSHLCRVKKAATPSSAATRRHYCDL